ncbi:MAG: DUF4326 domain-containing protein [Desulfosarcina sp.]|nr:DUF4326 domain-containing protein [Desulfosarcina sp.]
MPKRIQRKRIKGWRMPPNTVYVGRGSKWGNPHRVDEYRFESIDQCRNAARRDWRHDLECGSLPYSTEDIQRDLRGKNLACWCPLNSYCHADDLLELANK